MEQEETIAKIYTKLEVLIRLQAYSIIANKNVSEGAPILRRLGLTPTEIAAIFDTTSNSVKVRIAESKKKVSKSPKNTTNSKK